VLGGSIFDRTYLLGCQSRVPNKTLTGVQLNHDITRSKRADI